MAKNPDDRYPGVAELIADLEAVAAGEAPLQARKKYDHRLLESLAHGGQLIEDSEGLSDRAMGGGRLPVQWAVALGVLLAVSLLANVLMIALTAGRSSG